MDQGVIDGGGVNGAANLSRALGWLGSRLQTGQVGVYVVLFLVGALYVLGMVDLAMSTDRNFADMQSSSRSTTQLDPERPAAAAAGRRAAGRCLCRAARAKTWRSCVTMLELLLSLGLWWAFDPTATAHAVRRRARPGCRSGASATPSGSTASRSSWCCSPPVIMPLAVLGSFKYITERERLYYALMLTLTTGMLGVFLALDMFLFYVFWEVMLIPMYFIIGIWGGKNRLYAAIKFFIYTMAGSLLMLVAILVMMFQVLGQHRDSRASPTTPS